MGAAPLGDEGSWGSTGNVPSAITHPEGLLPHIAPEVPTAPCGPPALHDPQSLHEALQPLGASMKHRDPHQAFPNPHSPIRPPHFQIPSAAPRHSPPHHRDLPAAPHTAPRAPPGASRPPDPPAGPPPPPPRLSVQPHSPKDPAPRKPPAPPLASPALRALRSPAAPYRGSAPPGC